MFLIEYRPYCGVLNFNICLPRLCSQYLVSVVEVSVSINLNLRSLGLMHVITPLIHGEIFIAAIPTTPSIRAKFRYTALICPKRGE